MAAPKVLKKLAMVLGLYAPTRKLWRWLSGEARHQLTDDVTLYRNFINSGDLVFDIGANMGVKSEAFAFIGANIIAVEPNPNCWPILKQAMGNHESFVLVGEAVGSAIGKATLNFAGTSSTASIDPDWHGLKYNVGLDETIEVPVTTLDALIERHGVPDFCKIDVEGFELQVLKGLCSPIKTLSLEFHRDQLDELIACLDALKKISPISTNLMQMNNASLMLAKWVTTPELIDLMQSPEAPLSGDVFVKMEF